MSAVEHVQEPAVLRDPPRIDGDPEADDIDAGRCPSCHCELPAAVRDRAFAAARRHLEGHFARKHAEQMDRLAREHEELLAAERARFEAERSELIKATAEATAALIESRKR